MLNAEKIKNLIYAKYPAACVRVFDTTDSTNTRAKEDKTLSLGMICARAQTAGRGRQGHTFYSPADTGLYMTAVLPITPMQAYEFSLTAAAAVACVRAISKLCKKTPHIKWVNDLYLDGKKIAGILTEADSNRVIVGIGINVTTDIFPPDLPRAGSLGIDADLSELAAALFLELADMALRGDGSFMAEYRSLSMLLGKRLSYMQNGVLTEAEATAIDDMGRLEVRLDSGERVLLSSGEVNIVM